MLLSRQIGRTVISYVGDHATVTGTLAAGCDTPSCGIDPATVQVDAHVTVGGLRVASVRSGAGTGRTVYLHRDRLGSVVATTLAGGLRGASYRWDAYGALEGATSDTGDAKSELGYTGALRLSGGLAVMGVRIYHAGLRTFLEPDPLEPFKYDYAGGDPINRVDPTGMEDYHVTENYPGSSRTMNTPPPVITCAQNGGCTEGIDVVGKRPFRRKLGPSDTFHEWRSGRYHERAAGLGNMHGSRINQGQHDRSFRSVFLRTFKWNITANYEVATSIPGKVTRLALSMASSWQVGKVLHRLGPTGAAYVTAQEIATPTMGSEIIAGLAWTDAIVVFVLNTTAVTGGLAVGVTIGSGWDALVEASFSVTFDAIYGGLSNSVR
jgi:RHS repeat-associated protein